jgi:spore maturation protein CgeB
MKLLIVGLKQAGQMGSYLASAATQLKLGFRIADASEAEASTRFGRSFHWRLRDKRPGRIAQFNATLLDICKEMRPDLLLTTGRAPLERVHLERIRTFGTKIINYSTDDPWNPALRASWFLEAIPYYDAIFTTRRANLDDFRRCGVMTVHYLPFAFDPLVHRPWPDSRSAHPSDVLFVGGCDVDRLPLISALIDAGLELALFGGYWNRYTKTRRFWRGLADQDTIRAASSAARVCLCLVRRANRDENVMRSFEAAAIGGCILAEDTTDHRELYGDAARYFSSLPQLVERARELIANTQLRFELSNNLRKRIVSGRNTYADRLTMMLQLSGMDLSERPASVLEVPISSNPEPN